MFDFENLSVYQKSRSLNKEIRCFIESTPKLNTYLKDQISRSCSSIVLNIAEGAGKHTKKDKCKFYFDARGSCFESASALSIIFDFGFIQESHCQIFYQKFEEIAKMLTGLIKSQSE